MNNRITRNNYMIILAVVALAAASFQLGTGWLQPTVAQSQLPDGSVTFVSSPIVFGISPGQKVRISLGTIPGSRAMNIVWIYRISNSSHQVLFESERIAVPKGWLFLDVSREDLNIEGEPETGRAQVMGQAFIEALRGAKPSDFIGSQELVDVDTGETITYYTLELKAAEVPDLNP